MTTYDKPRPSSVESQMVDISTALDGELDHCELLNVIDSVAQNDECRRFYLAARAAEAELDRAAAEETDPPAPSPTTWPQISRHLRASRSRTPSGFLRSHWLGAAVAAAALLVSFYFIRGLPGASLPQAPSTETDEITLGSKEMTDSRFVEIATEVLQADRHARLELVRLIDSVEREATRDRAREARSESGGEEFSPQSLDSVPDLREGGSRDRLNVQLW